MQLSTIFAKPVNRPIEGVIKADDEADLRLELEEYVLTNEVERRLEAFLEAYNRYTGANGVWVSGFFGSGKSHLLKMLALLLENREIDGKRAMEWFLPKCENNPMLRGGLQKAVVIPSKSILFNIDQKADIISKTEFDALLSVFVKVFNEMRGYYGKQGYIAQFEQDLDSRGQYDDFKAQYQAIAGRDWRLGREQFLLERTNIAKAYAEATGEPVSAADGILDQYRQTYRVSIEDFAESVKAYLDTQEKGFRLNFFVDEVGQYIAEHVKLMTNLQTIAESLATKCEGRAWVIVTAQEDMATVIGDMNRQQGNDFTKIQARFANRMKLTSQDVSEVIQKRLLTKNDDAVALLERTYQQQSNNFKTQFDFADGSQTYRNFQDEGHFVRSYPFIPYQFELFQSAIQQLSQHNAFEGKHSSVGERSMLGVFQEVAICIGEKPVGQLATFDLMFEGIRSTLKSSIQSSILRCERNLEHPFAVRLLKTLFLVKYVKEFKASVRNLCVLMFDSFEQDLSALRDTVQEALNLLEQQTYIQRNGELYEYLTDEEKDIEEEIKSTEIEEKAIAKELEELIFDRVIKQRKIRDGESKQDYPYSRKVDDRLVGREYELTIHVVTPFNDNVDEEQVLKMQSMGRNELLVVMPADDRFIVDVKIYKQTEKYLQQKATASQQEVTQRILTDKRFQNTERQRKLAKMAQLLLGKANLFVSGNEIEIGGEDAQNRVVSGFHELIKQVYPQLRMLRGNTYTEQDVGSYLLQSEEGLFGNDASSLSEPEQETLSKITSNNRGGVRTTVKSLVEIFEKKPYGWSSAAALCMLAKLCARGKVEVRADGQLLEEDVLKRSLQNSREHGNLLLEPQVEFTPGQVRQLKNFYEEFFDRPPAASEAKALGKEVAEAFKEKRSELEKLAVQAGQYPFLNVLMPVIEQLRAIGGKPYTWYLTELKGQADELLDLKEDAIAPIQRFMSGAQRKIYDDAKQFIQTQRPNADYLDGDGLKQINNILLDAQCFKGGKMQQLKTLLTATQAAVAEKIEAEASNAGAAIDELKAKLTGMPEFAELSAEQQVQLSEPFDQQVDGLAQQQLISQINDGLRRFRETQYPQLLSKMIAWIQPAPAPKSPDEPTKPASDTSYRESTSKASRSVVVEPVSEVVSYRSVRVDFDKAWLADEADVDGYLLAMKEAMLAEIRNGKRIQI
ncbi:MAG: BREX system P-loop protein BrxC [Cyanobacteria bacterium J06560_6]